jgi:hypothetical protein
LEDECSLCDEDDAGRVEELNEVLWLVRGLVVRVVGYDQTYRMCREEYQVV